MYLGILNNKYYIGVEDSVFRRRLVGYEIRAVAVAVGGYVQIALDYTYSLS